MNLYEIGLPDPEQFHIKEIGNKILIHRKEAGVKWNDKNKYFRSSLWDKETGKLISGGFRAFTNYGEQPDFEPLYENTSVKAITKMDGSLLCVSMFKDELIIRTRGTVDATKLENGFEIEFLKKKYPKAFDNHFIDSEMYTLLYEWTTPSNRIVLKESNEPTLWLIGIVDHIDYRYVDQINLDNYAEEFGVERPKTYGITLYTQGFGIDSLKKQIEPLKDIEGVVIYDHMNGQILKKIKTLRYLELHRVFTGVKSVDHLFDLFVEYGTPIREEFEKQLASNFDWELVTTLKPLLDELYDRWMYIGKKVNDIVQYVHNPMFRECDRKLQAHKIMKDFPDCTGIAFSILDRKEGDPHKLWKTFTADKIIKDILT
jgi:hypothetical protein